jgi:DNA-binding response OmpR family regulator
MPPEAEAVVQLEADAISDLRQLAHAAAVSGETFRGRFEAHILLVTERYGDWEESIELMESEGFLVETVPSGDDGLAQAITLQPDLVIADLNQGPQQTKNSTGYNLLASLRYDGRTQNIPFVLVGDERESDESHQALARDAMNSGADDYLSKPLRGSAVVAAIRARIRRHRGIVRHVLSGNEESFEAFSGKLLDAISRGGAVSDILRIVSKRIARHLGSQLATCAIRQMDKLESVDVEGIPARHWRRLDDLLDRLPVSDKPVSISAELDDFLRARCFHLQPDEFPCKVWRLPIRNPEGALLGAFFLFLPPGHGHDRWLSGDHREALERKCGLAAILLDRQRLHEELTRQTHFDALTGLPNRREFERHLLETIHPDAGHRPLSADQRGTRLRGSRPTVDGSGGTSASQLPGRRSSGAGCGRSVRTAHPGQTGTRRLASSCTTIAGSLLETVSDFGRASARQRQHRHRAVSGRRPFGAPPLLFV